MPTTYERERQVAVEAVRTSVRLCSAVQGSVQGAVRQKQDRSPVTVADFGSQALICRTLHDAFPDDPIIAEEDAGLLRQSSNALLRDRVVDAVRSVAAGAKAEQVCTWIDYGNAPAYSERLWTVDPIDGTKGFLRGDQYAVALALIVEGEVVVGVLGCPNLGESAGLYVAMRDAGAWYQPDAGHAAMPLTVSRVDTPPAARFCESVESSHSSQGDAARVANHLGITAPPVRLDSQAKYAVLARGDAEVYLRLPIGTGYVENIWDHAAGALLVEEAGGRVTDMHGQPLDFTRGTRLEANKGIVASNGILHDAVLDAIAAM